MSFWGSVIYYTFIVIGGGVTILVAIDIVKGDPHKPFFRQPYLRFWDWGGAKTEEEG